MSRHRRSKVPKPSRSYIMDSGSDTSRWDTVAVFFGDALGMGKCPQMAFVIRDISQTWYWYKARFSGID